MSNIRPLVHSTLYNILESQDGYHSKVDVLRVIEEEAMLMKETQYIIDMFDADPFDQFSQVKPQIERLKTLIQVKSCSRTRTTNDYCKIDAVVTFAEKKCDSSTTTTCNSLQLTFRYERKRRRRRQNAEDGSSSSVSKNGVHIRYSIEMAVNHQQRENLIVVEVWADNNLPSIEKAICVNQMLHGDDDNGNDSENDKWDDIERNNEGNTLKESIIKNPNASKEIGESSSLQKNGSKRKRQKLDGSHEETAKSGKNSLSKDGDSNSDTNHESNEPDSYLAYLNPDVLHDFLELSGLLSKNPEKMHDGTAFFLLMTFPFYDQEWDLVDHLLEGIFGDDEEE